MSKCLFVALFKQHLQFPQKPYDRSLDPPPIGCLFSGFDMIPTVDQDLAIGLHVWSNNVLNVTVQSYKMLVCPPGCVDCSAVNGCVRCSSGLFLFLYREGSRQHGMCVKACPQGYFKYDVNGYRRCYSKWWTQIHCVASVLDLRKTWLQNRPSTCNIIFRVLHSTLRELRHWDVLREVHRALHGVQGSLCPTMSARALLRGLQSNMHW